MEINRIGGDVIGVQVKADIVEGRMVYLSGSGATYDFGSRTDLPGALTPATAENAKRSRFIVTWAQDNRALPLYGTYPSLAINSMRGGWDQATNLPMTSQTIYTTYPGNQDGVTIPSGTLALAFGKGTYTIPSGAYVASADIRVVGAPVTVAYDAGNEGKLKYASAWDDSIVGTVEYYELASDKITVTLREF